jgi:hypothetical protein
MAVAAALLCLSKAQAKATTASSRNTIEHRTSTFPGVISVPVLPATKDDLTIWLEKLAIAESHNSSTMRVLDTNGHYSYSCMQFQMATWLSYGKPLGATEDNIYDCSLQKKVAAKMIRDNHKNWTHWYNSVVKKGVGKPPHIGD